MEDTILITRSSSVSVWDEDSLSYSDGAPVELYRGKGMVTLSAASDLTEEGSLQTLTGQYKISFPKSAATAGGPVRNGDWIQVIRSPRNPQMEGRIFRVREEQFSSFSVVRKVVAEYERGAA